MATKGTPQYNVWKTKYDARKIRKSGQQSLFSDEEQATLIAADKLPVASTYTLQFFYENVPSKLERGIWFDAARRATKNGSREACFGAVRSIYNIYKKRADEQEQRNIEHMMFCIRRAENEINLEESFN